MSVVIIGDLMIDDYKIVEVNRVSPEAPCLVGVDKCGYQRLGGAANVACNLSQLSKDMVLVGICRKDEFQPLLDNHGIKSHLLSGDHSVKTRFVDDRSNAQLFRYDIEKCLPQDGGENLIEYSEFIDEIDFKLHNVCVIADYMKGAVKHSAVKRLNGCRVNIVSTKNVYPHKVLPRHRNIKRLKASPVNILVLNAKEYSVTKEIWGFQYIIRTEGDKGISIFKVIEDDEQIFHEEQLLHHIDAVKIDVFDVTGAGDTVTAVIAFCFDKVKFSEENLIKACDLANREAAIVVSRRGTSVIESNADFLLSNFATEELL